MAKRHYLIGIFVIQDQIDDVTPPVHLIREANVLQALLQINVIHNEYVVNVLIGLQQTDLEVRHRVQERLPMILALGHLEVLRNY